MHHFPLLNDQDTEATLLAALSSPGFQVFRYAYCQTYLPETPLLDLLVITIADENARALALLHQTHETQTVLAALDDTGAVIAWLKASGVGIFYLDSALDLAPVYIPKPWGREIWFTGIEARGQSLFEDANGHSVPLPWLLSLLPETLLGEGRPALTLLKILDPLPEPVFGDLYFEMHEEKQEVYVVTGIDSQAWPDGQGGIRFGFDQSVRQRYISDEEFRTAYLSAVTRYEEIRRSIDDQIDAMRQAEGFGLNEPVSVRQQKQWLARIAEPLSASELEARQHMDSFARVLPLSLGDVVKVPCHTPHSLMHGVTTVEFQTPVYERKILSFAQKVLTQNHWDTADALAKINLDAPDNPALTRLHQGEGSLWEQVVRFDDFAVQRVTLAAGASCKLGGGNHYSLVMVVAGESLLQDRPLAQGRARLLPARVTAEVTNPAAAPLVLLVSEPL